ncbi:hypothetical protein FQZ97_964400 [compost metagenome]
MHFLDAGEIAAGTRTAQQAVDQILGRRPALHVQGKMDGALVGLDVLHGFLGEAVHPFLQDVGRARLDGVRAHLDLHVRADHIDLHVEVLQQQDKAEVGVLQLVLVARIAADTSRMPQVAGELDDATLLHQRDQLGTQEPAIELANRVHTTAQQTHAGQIGDAGGLRVQKEAPVLRGLSGEPIQTHLINCLFHCSFPISE